MAKNALILVDIQNDYFADGRNPLTGIDEAATKAARVLQAARAAGTLVVHIRHEFPTTDAPFFLPGSSGAAIHSSVLNHDGETVLTKSEVNSFQGTGLKNLLDENGITDVTIVGAMSHMCVDAAARAASDFGYATTVVHDAVATRNLEFGGKTIPADQVHAAFMSALAFGYAKVISTDEYLAA